MIDVSPEKIIQAGGALLVGGVIFAESAFLIGIIMPGGDTLLFMSGFFASQGLLQIHWLIIFIIIGAVLGDNVGYTIGRRAGPRLFRKQDGLFFRKDHIERASSFYETHGGKTVTLARFVPVVRTFAPMMAGVARMDRRRFMIYNVVGAVVWATVVPLLGYFLGSKIPNIDKYLGPIVVVAFVLTFIPPLVPIMRDPIARRTLAGHIRKVWQNIGRYVRLNKQP